MTEHATTTDAPAPAAGALASADLPSIEDLEEAMRDVVDPELGINVVDLGLVYGIHVGTEGRAGSEHGTEDRTEEGTGEQAGDDTVPTPRTVATLDMTLTSAACPLTDVIEDQTRSALTTGPGGGLVDDFRINWVWMPPWGPNKITDEGRDQLRALGFNV